MTVALPRRTISYGEGLAGAIAIALGLGSILALLVPTKIDLYPLQSGWNDYVLTLETVIDEINNPVQPTPTEPSWIPQVPGLPQIDLGRLQVPALPTVQQRPKHWHWIVQPEPCPTNELGNHLNGATGLNHCLIREEQNANSVIEDWESDPAYKPGWMR